MIMDDSMLMPPPPPRPPKRQRASTSPPSVATTSAAGKPAHPHSILIPPRGGVRRRGGCGAANGGEYFENPPAAVECERADARSVSPEDFGVVVDGGKRREGSSAVDRVAAAADDFATERSEGGRRTAAAARSPFVDGASDGREGASPPPGDGGRFGGASDDDEDRAVMGRCGEGVFRDDAPRDSNEISESDRGGEQEQQGAKKGKQPGGGNGDSPAPRVDVSFRDIIGHGQAKLRLDEALLPLALPPDLADSVLTGIRAAPASILLHGPPGCGKTKLAKAVAGEAQAAFLSVGPSDILSKFVGESEASIRGLFREARRKAQKMESKCAVVFFDEIDALGRSRVDDDSGGTSQAGGDSSSRRVLAELLIQMTNLAHGNGCEDDESDTEGEEEEGYDDGEECNDGSTMSTGTGMFDGNDGDVGMRPSDDSLGPRSMSPVPSSNLFEMKVQVQADEEVGTPTRPGEQEVVGTPTAGTQPKPRVIVVAATNRPEDCDPALLRRFAVRVLVGLPSRRDRKKIVRRLLSDVEHDITSSQLDALALATEGWSGSDLESVTREAAMAPVRECLRAAAVLKRRESRAAERAAAGARGGGGSDDGADLSSPRAAAARDEGRGGAGAAEDALDAARESLLSSFRSLRPVSSKDFEDGIAFFLGEQQQDSSAFGQFDNSSKQAHYDSSSSSEDEE